MIPLDYEAAGQQKLGGGVTAELVGQFLIYRFSSDGQETFDIFYESCIAYLKRQKAQDQPYYLLLDFSAVVGITLYSREKAKILVDYIHTHQIKGYSAVVLPRFSLLMPLIIQLNRWISHKIKTDMTFLDFQKALDWLTEMSQHEAEKVSG